MIVSKTILFGLTFLLFTVFTYWPIIAPVPIVTPKNITKVTPDNHYEVENIAFSTVPAYNISKQFHPKANNWVGYIINTNNTLYYIAGDTDITEEAKQVKCDIAFLPVGRYIHNEPWGSSRPCQYNWA